MAVARDYGNDMHSDSIACVRLDPQQQRQQHLVEFDFDDRDAAIAELDRLHADHLTTEDEITDHDVAARSDVGADEEEARQDR